MISLFHSAEDRQTCVNPVHLVMGMTVVVLLMVRLWLVVVGVMVVVFVVDLVGVAVIVVVLVVVVVAVIVDVVVVEVAITQGLSLVTGHLGCPKKTKVVMIISATLLSHSIPVGELPKKI